LSRSPKPAPNQKCMSAVSRQRQTSIVKYIPYTQTN
jgi:hypothetical protein